MRKKPYGHKAHERHYKSGKVVFIKAKGVKTVKTKHPEVLIWKVDADSESENFYGNIVLEAIKAKPARSRDDVIAAVSAKLWKDKSYESKYYCDGAAKIIYDGSIDDLIEEGFVTKGKITAKKVEKPKPVVVAEPKKRKPKDAQDGGVEEQKRLYKESGASHNKRVDAFNEILREGLTISDFEGMVKRRPDFYAQFAHFLAPGYEKLPKDTPVRDIRALLKNPSEEIPEIDPADVEEIPEIPEIDAADVEEVEGDAWVDAMYDIVGKQYGVHVEEEGYDGVSVVLSSTSPDALIGVAFEAAPRFSKTVPGLHAVVKKMMRGPAQTATVNGNKVVGLNTYAQLSPAQEVGLKAVLSRTVKGARNLSFHPTNVEFDRILLINGEIPCVALMSQNGRSALITQVDIKKASALETAHMSGGASVTPPAAPPSAPTREPGATAKDFFKDHIEMVHVGDGGTKNIPVTVVNKPTTKPAQKQTSDKLPDIPKTAAYLKDLGKQLAAAQDVSKINFYIDKIYDKAIGLQSGRDKFKNLLAALEEEGFVEIIDNKFIHFK